MSLGKCCSCLDEAIGGSWWRGRRMTYDPDARAIENERQIWVSEQLAGQAEVVIELTVDRDRAYCQWRAEYEATGDENALAMMLEYVQ